MPLLTGSQMRYLHVIYTAQTNEGIRCVDISRKMGVTKASVSRMVKLLADFGLTRVNDSGKIRLTRKGAAEGSAIHQKIARLHSFFSEYLELDEPEAINSTYSFLCNFSNDCVEKLAEKGWGAVQAD